MTVLTLLLLVLFSYTPLMEAAREGHEEVVTLLVEHGAHVNGQTEETQETALTLACCGGFLDVVQYLIEHGALSLSLSPSLPKTIPLFPALLERICLLLFLSFPYN